MATRKIHVTTPRTMFAAAAIAPTPARANVARAAVARLVAPQLTLSFPEASPFRQIRPRGYNSSGRVLKRRADGL